MVLPCAEKQSINRKSESKIRRREERKRKKKVRQHNEINENI
jgi:hypothetical protein